MARTGRRIAGPAVELVELAATSGLKHLALVHHESWRGHPLLATELPARLGFMEQPGTSGVCRLVAHELEAGQFVYPTGTVWTVSEIVRTYAENGASAGVRAGLELCYLVAESLVEAADAGLPQGVPSHGNINPWNVVLKGDGQPTVLGYGIPQVELLAWRDDSRLAMVEDTFRYAPPERIEGGEEDLSSDLFSLALVALEVMVGRPVYDGVLADVKQQATRGEGMRRLYQWRERLPQNVREVIGRALKPDPDTRFPNGLELVYAVHDLLGSIDVEGPSLTEVMAKIRASEKRGKALKGGQTLLLTREEMAEMAADLGDFDEKLRPPRRPRPDGPVTIDGQEPAAPAQAAAGKARWTKPNRKAEVPANVPPAPAPAPAVAAEVVPTRRPREVVAEEPVDREAEREQLRRRLRAREVPQAGNAGAPTIDPAAPAPPDPAATPQARVTTSDESEGQRAKSAAAALLERLRTSGGRRRLRASAAEPVVAAPAPSPVAAPVPVAAQAAPVVTPLHVPLAVAPPPPPPKAIRTLVPTIAPRAADEAPLRRWVYVAEGRRKAQLPWRKDEAPWSLALRAAVELGGLPVDPSGRLVGGYRVARDGKVVITPVDPGSYELLFVPAEERVVEVVANTEPPTRLRTAVSLVAPAGWVVGGLVRWLALPAGDWVLWVGGAVDGDQLLVDAIGTATTLELRLRPL